jgi:peptidoglycan hydrolase-like protein with peptidoglycan-binding domain
VTALQRRLAEANLFGSEPNGVYDGETYGGVAGYQMRHGITSDPIGVYGPATRAALEKQYP